MPYVVGGRTARIIPIKRFAEEPRSSGPSDSEQSPGMRLRALRESCALTRRALAALLECSEETIRSWETGRRGMGVRIVPELTSATIRAERVAHRLSRRELAELIGYSQWTIRGWEHGTKHIPDDLAPTFYEILAQVAAHEVAEHIDTRRAFQEACAG